MNLQRGNLHTLISHKHKLQTILSGTEVFFVGGSIRDLLLGINNDLIDIDCACAGDPNIIRERIQEQTIDDGSIFRTEKFGTISIVYDESTVEITPFRTEGTYGDVRHPDHIDWSDSLVADSKRRDFTINALYWTAYTQARNTVSTLTSPTVHEATIRYKDKAIIVENCLILQDTNTIEALYGSGTLHQDTFQKIINNAVIIGEQKTHGNELSIILDPQLGINDLQQGIIKTVGEASERFSEDALRILRGARFVITLNDALSESQSSVSFDIRKKTRNAMKQYSSLVEKISFERINQELNKVFSGNNPYGYIALLHELGVMGYIFPAVGACVGNHQPTRHHGFDTYSHTLLTLHALQQNSQADILMKFAMLYHDTGKPEQYEFIEKAIQENPDNPDRSGYEHHAEISVRLAQNDFKRLCFSKKDIQTICRYIKWHHRPGEILEGNEKNINKKLRSLISDGDETMAVNLIDIAIADRLGQLNPIQPPETQGLIMLKERIQTIIDTEGRFTMKNLIIDGHRLMKEYQLEPGRDLGNLLKKIFERVVADCTKRNNIRTIKTYVESLQSNSL